MRAAANDIRKDGILQDHKGIMTSSCIVSSGLWQ
jgi:hypothetical protein